MNSEPERLLNVQNCVNMRLRRTSRLISDFYNSVMEPSGLHGNQFMLLIPLNLKARWTINELAEVAGLDRTTLARNLKLFEERRLITLEPGKDQRTRMVQITELGRKTLFEALPLWEEAQRQMIDYLGQPQFNTLFGTLEQVETALKNKPE